VNIHYGIYAASIRLSAARRSSGSFMARHSQELRRKGAALHHKLEEPDF
jgi:hypothetical protein